MRPRNRKRCVKVQKDEMICSSASCIEDKGSLAERPFISRKYSLSIPSGKVSTLWLVQNRLETVKTDTLIVRGSPKD